MQQFGGAIGVAVIGTMFFQVLPEHAFLGATKTTVLVAIGLFVVSLAVTWLLPGAPAKAPPPTDHLAGR